MKKFYYVAAIIAVVFLCACENQEKKEVQALFKEVMEVHDGVMPKMDDIHEARKALKDQLSSSDSTAVFALLEQLAQADESMMVWMEEFNSSFETMPLPEQKKYLEAEMQKITKVRDLMLGAISESQKWIESHDKTEVK